LIDQAWVQGKGGGEKKKAVTEGGGEEKKPIQTGREKEKKASISFLKSAFNDLEGEICCTPTQRGEGKRFQLLGEWVGQLGKKDKVFREKSGRE